MHFIPGQAFPRYLAEKDLYFLRGEQPRHRFNVIGTGLMGLEHMHVTALEGRAAIHGIYDADSHSAAFAEAAFGPAGKPVIYPTLQDAFADPQADALLICTPNYTHIDIVREAVKTGKHIFLEKPMVTTLEDAVELVGLAKDYPAVFQVGLQYRYKAIYAEARREILQNRSLGDIRLISIVENRIPFLDKVKQWNKFSAFSGGTLVEKCCHYFDLFNLFAQSRPDYVFAVGSQAVNFKTFDYDGRRSDILDNATVTMVYENGVTCSFNLCMFAPTAYEELTVCGVKGRLRAYENDNALPVDCPRAGLELLTADNGVSRVSQPCYPRPIQESGHMGGTYFEHRAFIENIEGHQTDCATVEDGFWSVAVGVAAEQSVQTGEKVYLRDLLFPYRQKLEAYGIVLT